MNNPIDIFVSAARRQGLTQAKLIKALSNKEDKDRKLALLKPIMDRLPKE